MSLEYRRFLSTFILPMVNNWLKSNHNAVTGPCLLCDDKAALKTGLCEACLDSLPTMTKSCTHCGIGLPESSGIAICGQCLQHTPPIEQTVSVFHYQAPLDFLLQSLKFREQLGVARLMAQQLAQKVARECETMPDCIIPVPLHKERLRERGYNQALEIARPLSRQLKLAIDYHHCRRVKATQAQSELSAKARSTNIRGAFEFSGQAPWKHVAIVDDVMTTGNTLWEMARCLKNAGVSRVAAWVCARAY